MLRSSLPCLADGGANKAHVEEKSSKDNDKTTTPPETSQNVAKPVGIRVGSLLIAGCSGALQDEKLVGDHGETAELFHSHILPCL